MYVESRKMVQMKGRDMWMAVGEMNWEIGTDLCKTVS